MAWESFDRKRMKQISKQLAGNYKENDKNTSELIPCVLIKGQGDIWCAHITERRVVRVVRGTKGYILSDDLDDQGRLPVFTEAGDMIAIDPDEIEEIGFN